MSDAPPRPRSRWLWRLVVGLVFTVPLVIAVRPYLDGALILETARRATLAPLLIGFAAFTGITLVRAVRFRLCGARGSLPLLFAIAALHAAALRFMPLRSGELAYGLLLQHSRVGKFGTGMASILMLRLLDAVILLPTAALVAGLMLGVPAGWVVGLGVVTLLLGALFFALAPLSRRLTELHLVVTRPFWQRKIHRLATIVGAAYDLPLRNRLALLVMSLATWLFTFIWLGYSAIGAGAGLDPLEASLVGVLGAAGSAVPISLVGSFGPLESGLGIGLAACGLSGTAAAAVALVSSLLTLACNLALAIPSLLLFPWLAKRTAVSSATAPGMH